MVRPRKHRLAVDIALESCFAGLEQAFIGDKPGPLSAFALIDELALYLARGKGESKLFREFREVSSRHVEFYQALLKRQSITAGPKTLQSMLLSSLYEYLVFGGQSAAQRSGVFFTPPYLACFAGHIAHKAWMKSGFEQRLPVVLEPAMGSGVLLLGAAAALQECGLAAREIVPLLHGIEIDKNLHALALRLLSHCLGPSVQEHSANFILGDSLRAALPQCDILITNPPWEIVKQNSMRGIVHSDAHSLKRNLKERRFKLQSVGDVSAYKLFVERALSATEERENSVVAVITPASINTDKGASLLRNEMLRGHWQSFGFENIDHAFPIHPSFRYALSIVARGGPAKLSFCAGLRGRSPLELGPRVLSLSPSALATISPSLAVPIVSSEEELALVKKLYREPPLSRLVAPKKAGAKARDYKPEFNGIYQCLLFKREIDLSLRKCDLIDASGAESSSYPPIIEGRMVGQYDLFAKQWLSGHGRSANWLALPPCKRRIAPQYYLRSKPVEPAGFKIGFSSITASTNRQVMQAALLPDFPCASSVTVLRVAGNDAFLAAIVLSVLNSIVFDFVLRSRLTGNNLNYFILEECPVPQALIALREDSLSDEERLYLGAIATISAFLSYNHKTLQSFIEKFESQDLKLSCHYKKLWSLKSHSPEGFIYCSEALSEELRLLLEVIVCRLYRLSVDEISVIVLAGSLPDIADSLLACARRFENQSAEDLVDIVLARLNSFSTIGG